MSLSVPTENTEVMMMGPRKLSIKEKLENLGTNPNAFFGGETYFVWNYWHKILNDFTCVYVHLHEVCSESFYRPPEQSLQVSEQMLNSFYVRVRARVRARARTCVKCAQKVSTDPLNNPCKFQSKCSTPSMCACVCVRARVRARARTCVNCAQKAPTALLNNPTKFQSKRSTPSM